MSFPDREVLFGLMEEMFAAIWRECLEVEISTPWPRMSFAEADRPLRRARAALRPRQPRHALRPRARARARAHARLGVRRLRRRRHGPVPARAADVLARRARGTRGAR